MYYQYKEEIFSRASLAFYRYENNKSVDNKLVLLRELGFLRSGNVPKVKSKEKEKAKSKLTGALLIPSLVIIPIGVIATFMVSGGVFATVAAALALAGIMLYCFFQLFYKKILLWRMGWRELAEEMANEAGLKDGYSAKYSKSACKKVFLSSLIPKAALCCIAGLGMGIALPMAILGYSNVGIILYIVAPVLGLVAYLVVGIALLKRPDFAEVKEMYEAVKVAREDKEFKNAAERVEIYVDSNVIGFDVF